MSPKRIKMRSACKESIILGISVIMHMCDAMEKDAVRTEAAHTDEFVIILLTEGQKWPTG